MVRQAVSGGGSQEGVAGDYVQRSEFRALLVALRQYYELYAMFNRLDSSDDRRLDYGEFQAGAERIARWGVDLPPTEVRAAFDSIDANGGGVVLFDEFAAWAIAMSLDLEDDDDVDGTA